MQPSALYNVDYTDSYGFKWSKAIGTMYPSIGLIDESIGYSKYEADIMKTVYRKTDSYNAIYDDSLTIGRYPGSATDVAKYFKRTAYPTSPVNINTVIVNNASTPDGWAYSIGTSEEASIPLNRGSLNSSRILVDAPYNKMLFRVNVREMSLNTDLSVIQKNLYEDPSYTDISIGDVDDAKYYAFFYHSDCKVWNGSSWVNASYNPVLMCAGESNQTFQGAGSSFSNCFTNYSMQYGTGYPIQITTTSSAYYWSNNNFQSKMNDQKYCLAWSDSYDYFPYFAYDAEGTYATVKQWLVDHSITPWNTVSFQLSREVHDIGDDAAVLLTVMATFGLDNNGELYCQYMNTYTFPLIKGSSIKKFIAGFGLYYLADNNADLTGITPDNLGDSDDIWLGEMNADGTTTGNWIKGSELNTYTGYNKDNNIINPDYDPAGGSGSDIRDDVDDMTLNPLFTIKSDAGFAAYWLLTSSDIASLHNWLTATIFPDGYDPYQYIISLIQYPLNLVPSWCFTGTPGSIHIGSEDTGINANLIGTEKAYVGLGTFNVPRIQGNFLDYDPYSQYEVYIPCCGWVTVPDIVAGHTIACRINYDLTTAAIIGNVYVSIEGSWLLIASKSGMMGRETVVSGEAQGVRSAQIQSALFSAGTGAINVAAGLMSGNAVAAVSGTYSMAAGIAQANVANNSSYVRQIGSTGGRALLCQFDRCYCKITTSEADVPDNYGHTVGFICNRSGKVSSFSGFTVFENFDTSGIAGATESERAEIRRIMESGVIIK